MSGGKALGGNKASLQAEDLEGLLADSCWDRSSQGWRGSQGWGGSQREGGCWKERSTQKQQGAWRFGGHQRQMGLSDSLRVLNGRLISIGIPSLKGWKLAQGWPSSGAASCRDRGTWRSSWRSHSSPGGLAPPAPPAVPTALPHPGIKQCPCPMWSPHHQQQLLQLLGHSHAGATAAGDARGAHRSIQSIARGLEALGATGTPWLLCGPWPGACESLPATPKVPVVSGPWPMAQQTATVASRMPLSHGSGTAQPHCTGTRWG